VTVDVLCQQSAGQLSCALGLYQIWDNLICCDYLLTYLSR